MRELSERELLLLANYLYLEKCTEYRTIKDAIDSCRDAEGNISEEKVVALGVGGCMSAAEGADLLDEMDRSSEDFKNLNAVRSINDGGIRGICFADIKDDHNAVVVFRGTGGTYDAWADNVRGEYMADTKMQKLADDFVRYDCGVYDNITVSGHSKGGNMAQYVTVTNTDRVSRCVSFDGQGLGHTCAAAHESQIKAVAGRIKSISAHNDYVNLLLGCIAGECIFVKNMRSDAVGRHSSYSLLKSCEFDSEGNITNTCSQEPLMKWVAGFGRRITDRIDSLPEDGNRSVSELLTASVAAMFSNEYDDVYEKEKIVEAADGVGLYAAGVTGFDTGGIYDVSTVTDSVYVDMNGLAKAGEMFIAIQSELRDISETIAGIRGRINYEAASKLAVDTILHRQENALIREGKKLEDHAGALKEISALYSGCENELTERIRGTVFDN
jgi:hypothetical protein